MLRASGSPAWPCWALFCPRSLRHVSQPGRRCSGSCQSRWGQDRTVGCKQRRLLAAAGTSLVVFGALFSPDDQIEGIVSHKAQLGVCWMADRVFGEKELGIMHLPLCKGAWVGASFGDVQGLRQGDPRIATCPAWSRRAAKPVIVELVLPEQALSKCSL